MYRPFFIILVFLFCGLQSFGNEPAEQDLLNAALQEIAKNESEKKAKRELAEKARQAEPSTPTLSSSQKNFDFGDVVVTISERELEEAPEAYFLEEDNSPTVLSVKKKPRRRTSSIPSQEQPQRDPSSEQ